MRRLYKLLMIRLVRRLQYRRLPLSDLFFFDHSFTTPLDTKSKSISYYGRCYEVCQWSPSSFNGQTTRCVAITEKVENRDRLIRFDFFTATTSRYYAAVALGIWCANWETGCTALNKTGHFEILSPEECDDEEFSSLPHYDIS